MQSQWIGPYTFTFKAEVDWDGTYLAAKLLSRSEPASQPHDSPLLCMDVASLCNL